MDLSRDVRLATCDGACGGCRAPLLRDEQARGLCASCVLDFLTDFASAVWLGSVYNYRFRPSFRLVKGES